MASVAQEGDVILLVSPDRRHYLVRLRAGEQWSSHLGNIPHSDIIGQPLGRTVRTQHGQPYLALEPSTHDLIHELPRTTQIIYAKDAAQIALRLSLYPGRRIIEAGTGSAGLTLVLARSIMPTGRVYSYETRQDSFDMARDNLDQLGLLPYVTLYNEDITAGFHENEVDAVFLDLREPWLFLGHAWNSLKGSGFFGALVPTVNQVADLLGGMKTMPFGDIVVEEIYVRPWKPVPERLRPEDRMIAHSAFLVFARKLQAEDASMTWEPNKKRRAYLAKQAMAVREVERAAAEAAADANGETKPRGPVSPVFAWRRREATDE
jgi:tRNA (adenine57-N1/adenine58-N1)-methyltransferase catalytic subunit